MEKKNSDKRREEFIDAAEKLFRENGIVDTTVNAIVSQMNVAKGLFYYYFKSKDDVIDAISDKYNSGFKEKLKECADKSADFDERLRRLIRETMHSFRKMWTEFDTQSNVDLTILVDKTINEAKETATEALKQMLQEGNDLGILRVPNPKRYAEAIVGAIAEMERHAEADTKEIMEMIEKMIRGN